MDGFYKYDGDLLFGQFIQGPSYELVNACKSQYSYPFDGWTWFPDETTARTTLGVPSLPVGLVS